jgi:asparagine synthase (glutamine-hydrolysing)
LKYYLKDDLLVKVDRSSMKYGLECRVPLLDHELVNFSVNLDQRLKKKKGVSKYLLKKILYKHVPATYFNRPKWGFGIPMASWLNNDLRYLVSDYLDKKTTTDLGYFQHDEIQSLLSRFQNGESYLYNRLWLIILLHKWLKENSELL